MAKLEIINGVRFIDGYLCNDAGQPITMNNGYSSDEERDAARYYDTLKRSMTPTAPKPKKKKPRVRTYYTPEREDEWLK